MAPEKNFDPGPAGAMAPVKYSDPGPAGAGRGFGPGPAGAKRGLAPFGPGPGKILIFTNYSLHDLPRQLRHFLDDMSNRVEQHKFR